MEPLIDKSSHIWHTLSVEEVLTHLDSNRRGLADDEAVRRSAQYGPNELQIGESVSLQRKGVWGGGPLHGGVVHYCWSGVDSCAGAGVYEMAAV